MKRIAQLSVFFPAYNEEANIRTTVEKALAVLPTVAEQYEVMIIDDGSKDKTGQIAKQLAKENPEVRLLQHAVNKGYGSALRTGFYSAQYDPIVFTDADGQFDFTEVTKFVEHITTADMVIGYRIQRMDPFMRKLNAWGWKMLIRLFFGLPVKDVDCAFKMVRRSVLERISPLESTRGGMISPELLVKAHRAGIAFVQVGVHHYPRNGGSPTGASIKVIAISLMELVKLRIKMTFTKQKPAGSGNLEAYAN